MIVYFMARLMWDTSGNSVVSCCVYRILMSTVPLETPSCQPHKYRSCKFHWDDFSTVSLNQILSSCQQPFPSIFHSTTEHISSTNLVSSQHTSAVSHLTLSITAVSSASHLRHLLLLTKYIFFQSFTLQPHSLTYVQYNTNNGV